MGCAPSAAVAKKAPTWNEFDTEGSTSPYYSDYKTKPEDWVKPQGDSEYYTCDKTSCVNIRYAQSGIASKAETPGRTVSELFCLAAKNFPSKPALLWETCPNTLGKGEKAPPCTPINEWSKMTIAEYYSECVIVAQAFIALGMKQFDSVAIYGFNSPEWYISEVACIIGGGIAAGIYPTDTKEQVRYKTRHSGSVVACVENMSKITMYTELAPDLPNLKAIVVWAPAANDNLKDVTLPDGRVVKVMTWADLKKFGQASRGGEYETPEHRMTLQKPGHASCYIYTSGTTGEPKAVMVSHDSIIFEATNAVRLIGVNPNGCDRIISYLPLSHVAGMMLDIICPIVLPALYNSWCEVYFARSYDLRAGTIGDRLRGVKPTLFLGVPRVWEKIQEKIESLIAANPMTGIKLKIARWGKGKGLEHQRNCQMGGSGARGCCYSFADKKVLTVAKQRLGLDECRFAFTGAAPVKTETLEFFGALGININEVYGMSECTGATTWSTDFAHKWGFCGFPMPGTEVRVFREDGSVCPRWNPAAGPPSEKEQGEICFRGRHVMMGYCANPELGAEHVATIAAKTKESIDSRGWLRSGDKGVMDMDGMIKITGRYKELIIGGGGENIAPVPIEDSVKRRCPAISNIVMIGDKRKFNVALVTLKTVGATGEAPGGDDLDGAALALDPSVTKVSQAMDSQIIIKAIEKAIMDTNKDSDIVPSNAAMIQKFSILPIDFSTQTGELTPTLKLKRNVVDAQYSAFVDLFFIDKNVNNNYVKYQAKGKK